MPQVLKQEVRARIQAAALEEFAAQGYERATMSAIAARADVATANLYRYYPGKKDLLDAVLPAELAERFEALLEESVRSFTHVATAEQPPRPELSVAMDLSHPERSDGAAKLLRFWRDHRLACVILLDRADGTPYAAFGARFVDRLVQLTLSEIHKAHPGVRISNIDRRVLEHVFENTRRAISGILRENSTEHAIIEAVQAFRSYQVPGIWGLTRWIRERSFADPRATKLR